MKIQLTAILMSLTLVLNAQEIMLENLWVKGSDTLYAGLSNFLRIEGDVNSISKIDANVGVQIQHDTLLVLPTSGKVSITIHTSTSKKTFIYNAIGMPQLFLEFYCLDLKKASPTVKIKSTGIDDLYSHYTIVQYTMVIDGKQRTGQSNYLTSEVLSAIDNLPAGKSFQINSIIFWNRETDHYISVDPDLVFELDYVKKREHNFSNSCIVDYIAASTGSVH